MDVIHMGGEVSFISNQVLPVTSLPDPTLTSLVAGFGLPFIMGNGLRETTFDQAPTQCKVRISLRESDKTMDMIRQDHPTENCKRISLTDITDHGPKTSNITNKQVILLALQ